jgi:hypothetical protein
MYSGVFSNSRKTDGIVDVLMELRRVGTTITTQTPETGIKSPFPKATAFDVVIGIVNPITGYAATVNAQGNVTGAYWLFEIQVSSAINGTYTTVESFTPTNGNAQRVRVGISYAQLPPSPGAEFVRIRATPVGGVGGVNYYAFINPSQKPPYR